DRFFHRNHGRRRTLLGWPAASLRTRPPRVECGGNRTVGIGSHGLGRKRTRLLVAGLGEIRHTLSRDHESLWSPMGRRRCIYYRKLFTATVYERFQGKRTGVERPLVPGWFPFRFHQRYRSQQPESIADRQLSGRTSNVTRGSRRRRHWNVLVS